MGHTHDRFVATSLTLIRRAADGGADLERYFDLYWGPTYAFLRVQRGLGPADADDLTQEFMATVILGRGLLRSYDSTKGRYRSYHLAALVHFQVEVHRRVAGRDGSRVRLFTMGDEDRSYADRVVDEAASAEATFDRIWARGLLNQCVQEASARLATPAQRRQWRAFELRTLQPLYHGGRAPSLARIAGELGEPVPERVSSLIQGAHRHFTRVLAERLQELGVSRIDMQDQLAEIAAIL